MKKEKGANRESNPRPHAPEARIIPLDHSPSRTPRLLALFQHKMALLQQVSTRKIFSASDLRNYVNCLVPTGAGEGIRYMCAVSVDVRVFPNLSKMLIATTSSKYFTEIAPLLLLFLLPCLFILFLW